MATVELASTENHMTARNRLFTATTAKTSLYPNSSSSSQCISLSVCRVSDNLRRPCMNRFIHCFIPDWGIFQVELVDSPISAQVGERITFPGFEGGPDDVLNLEQVWETLQGRIAQ
ncbi:hypothetical protein RchiOBHm_Chr1g0332211 [Rosa chinensis]|uniref:Uncharacterized protein n=1 Tax=Rosa chinensis TaxID=74649 RepID=A0A2P6SBQ4_ROSCH|nr:hypothetical protein RchiOBHm_Chr1g0332211 [Rosa chinensis]